MDASGEVSNPLLPFPEIYRSKGATPPKTLRVAPINAGSTLRRCRAGPATLKAAHAHVRNHYAVVTERPRCPVTSAPTLPTTSAQRHLKRRAHYARPQPQLRSFNGRAPYLLRITPHAVRAKSSKNRPSMVVIDASI
jgi:hypothetical protein